MAENSKERRERAGADARSQQEADAQVVREKTARLRALRLARDAEAGNKTARRLPARLPRRRSTARRPPASPLRPRKSPAARGRPVCPYRSGWRLSKKMAATIEHRVLVAAPA
jgi:hypothetical protein